VSGSSSCTLVKSRFLEMYGQDPLVFRAPGRINLIGEHTDYNDGFVMPAAIGFYTWIAAQKRMDRSIEAYSEHFKEKVPLSLDDLSGGPTGHWSDFVRGVAAVLGCAGLTLTGANLVIAGDLPLGSGMSSSASLEVATALALIKLSNIVVTELELAKLCQKAEHEYVGTKCGIMDQFTAASGVVGQALMLDCRSLQCRALSIPHHLSIVVCNSMVRHQLASGEYNRRRLECEAAVTVLQREMKNVRALRDVSIEDLERHKHNLPEQTFRRCRHVILENQRVLAATEALKAGNAEQFGQFMFRSHASLRDDYEVSCKELDLLVDLASSSAGVYGARMMGGGFGGCTVNLVHSDHAVAFAADIRRWYRDKTGITPDIFICDTSSA
jgi:galactokinase